MKKLLGLLLCLFPVMCYSQVIKDVERGTVDCDTARTNWDIGLCLKYQLQRTQKTFDSIEKVYLINLDSFIVKSDLEKKELKKDNPNFLIDQMTNYRKIKEMFIESQKLFQKYIDYEVNIEGECYGMGRERRFGEIGRRINLLNQKIEDIRYLFDRTGVN